MVRAVITDALKPLLPRGWKFFPYRVTPDAINSTTVWVRLQTIAKLPEAPKSGVHVVTYVVTIAVPEADPSEADARLDDDVIALVQALDLLPNIRRATAEQVAVTDTSLGYDITVEIITYSKE
ncbi:hypothetical protein NY537_14735 [Curtobacterium flaccumfaciens pv. betae]|uniref:hypothetical protein n=1 Tax=Curtobacterium flaccumfaciens TaxID=2035 RepID=UPI0026599D0A|nr:hypothetical protein [Curtobacterium flaccumfaciens]MCS5513997.1 hypothetical protein [Curtobacterium flaccumfaciens pv. betae]